MAQHIWFSVLTVSTQILEIYPWL